MASTEKYFAAKSSEDCAEIVLDKADHHFNLLQASAYLTKVRRSWLAYHGAYFADVGSSHQILFNGEVGELAQLAVNHYANLCRHIITTITANRPALEARAINTDYRSLVQAQLANGLLDYYMREKKLEVYLKTAVEYAVILGTGYIKMEWNATSGTKIEFDEELNIPIYEGDVQFQNLSPFDVIFDTTKDQASLQDWVLCRSFKNKYDLIAKYPEKEDEIRSLPTRTQLFKYSSFIGSDETDDIPVYEFYHKRSEAVPDGRYLLFLSGNVVLLDTPLPYDELPVYRLTPGDILGTAFGYTPMFDVLPLQEAANSLYTTILTNQNAFGVQNVLIPRGADIVMNQLAGGLNAIEYNSQNGPPQALNLTQTPAEVFKFLEMLERQMELISGVSAVQRGAPAPNVKSGNAMALLQAQSLQFLSGLQQGYVMMVESVGTGLISMLKRFANTRRVAAIVGKNNSPYLKEFTADDLSNIHRVVVDTANPVSKTIAGRIQMADQLLQYQMLKSPEQYLQIYKTGSLDAALEESVNEFDLIKQENERLMDGSGAVMAVATDKHSSHIQHHSSVISSPALRENPELVQRALDHIQEHLNLLKTVDPMLLQLIGETSLAPPPEAPMPQGPQGPAELPLAPADAGLPSPAKPPAPFENMPTQASDL